MPRVTNFRKAVAATVSGATGIVDVIHGYREGPAVDGGDLLAVWTESSATNEQNAQFRVYSVTARVMVSADAQVGPDEDDPLDELEAHEQSVLTMCPLFLGGARVVSIDALFRPDERAVDLMFLGEVSNADSEV